MQHAHTACIAGCDDRRSEAFDLRFGHGLGLSLHERPIISRLKRLEHPVELKEGMVIALETWCPATGRGVGGTHREGDVVMTSHGPQVITRIRSDEPFVADPD